MFNFEGWKSKVMYCSIAPRHLIFKPFTEKFFWEMGRGAGRRTIGHGLQVICHHFIGFRLLLAWVNFILLSPSKLIRFLKTDLLMGLDKLYL